MTNRFLISAAVAALITGTGFANAQGTGSSREQPSAGSTVQQNAPSPERGGAASGTMHRDSGASGMKGAESTKGSDSHGMKASESNEKMPSSKSAQDTKMPVKNAGDNTKGDLVCNSGTMLGINCGLQVDSVEFSFTPKNGKNEIKNTVKVVPTRNSGPYATAKGESGGPVMANNHKDGKLTNPVESVTARGIASGAGGTEVTGNRCPPNVTCYTELYYAKINELLKAWGVALVTA